MATNTTDAQLRKGNPAAHRMSNPVYKARRKRCWERGQVRKAERIEAQRKAEQNNRELRVKGQPTPWQRRKIARYMNRHNVTFGAALSWFSNQRS